MRVRGRRGGSTARRRHGPSCLVLGGIMLTVVACGADVGSEDRAQMSDDTDTTGSPPAGETSRDDPEPAEDLSDSVTPADPADALMLHEPRVHNQPDVEVALEGVWAVEVDAGRTALVLHLGVGNPGPDPLRWAPGGDGSVVEVAGTTGEAATEVTLGPLDGGDLESTSPLAHLAIPADGQVELAPGDYAEVAAVYVVEAAAQDVRDAGEVTWTPAPASGPSPAPAVPPLTALYDTTKGSGEPH